MKTNSLARGFTLIELLVVTVIVGFLVGDALLMTAIAVTTWHNSHNAGLTAITVIGSQKLVGIGLSVLMLIACLFIPERRR